MTDVWKRCRIRQIYFRWLKHLWKFFEKIVKFFCYILKYFKVMFSFYGVSTQKTAKNCPIVTGPLNKYGVLQINLSPLEYTLIFPT